MRLIKTLVLLLLPVIVACLPTTLGAQARRTVLVAMVSRLERACAAAAIMQRMHAAPPCVILLPSDGATPSALTAAMRWLQSRRAKDSDQPAKRAAVVLY